MDKIVCKLKISIPDQVLLAPGPMVTTKHQQPVVCQIDAPTGANRLVAVFSITSDGAVDPWQCVNEVWTSKPIHDAASNTARHTQNVTVIAVALGPDGSGGMRNLFGSALQPIIRGPKISWDEAQPAEVNSP